MNFFYRCFVFIVVLLTSGASIAQSYQVRIYDGGRPAAEDSIKRAAEVLVAELKRAGNFQFDIRKEKFTGQENGVGFILREQAERLGWKFPAALKTFNPEGFFVQATGNKLMFIGKYASAFQPAVFTYLERLGFRYFLPGEEWHVIPSLRSPFVNVEILTQPDFQYRVLANGHGFNKDPKLTQNFEFWHMANRLGYSSPIEIGHSYQVIVANNKEAFQSHPEYFAGNVKRGELPAIFKFNVANPGLVDLVVKDARKRMEEKKRIGQPLDMLTMEPSDGSEWCNSPECLKIGTASDQAYYLTNTVARAIRKDYPGSWVGTLAYNDHIVPPAFKMEPNVFVMVTNGFNRSKYSTLELLEQWKKKVSRIGVYEYLSVYEWDNDLPGKIPAADPKFISRSIKDYYKAGVRVYLAETNIGWINKGPGQYVVSKLLWDHRANADSILEDFYSRAFGNAAGPIKKLYNSWQNYSYHFLSDNALVEWLDLVSQAERMTKDVRVQKRLDQVKIYLHYLVLYKRLKDQPTRENLNLVMNFAYRNFANAAFSTLPTLASLPKYSGFPELGFYETENQPWKTNKSELSAKELNKLIENDRNSLKKIEGLRSFSLPSSFKSLKKWKAPGSMAISPAVTPAYVGRTSFLIRIEKATGNYLEIASGFSAKAEDQKNVQMSIYPYAEFKQNRSLASRSWSAEQSRKDVKEKFEFKLKPGEYVLVVEDWEKMFTLKFSDAILYSVLTAGDQWLHTSSATGLNTFYFIVPPKVDRFVLYKSKVLKLISPSGRLVDLADGNEGSRVIEVNKGEHGLWQIYYQAGRIFLEGVPPYLGLHPDKMLIPEDQADL